jgi:hypothetical protein
MRRPHWRWVGYPRRTFLMGSLVRVWVRLRVSGVLRPATATRSNAILWAIGSPATVNLILRFFATSSSWLWLSTTRCGIARGIKCGSSLEESSPSISWRWGIVVHCVSRTKHVRVAHKATESVPGPPREDSTPFSLGKLIYAVFVNEVINRQMLILRDVLFWYH